MSAEAGGKALVAKRSAWGTLVWGPLAFAVNVAAEKVVAGLLPVNDAAATVLRKGGGGHDGRFLTELECRGGSHAEGKVRLVGRDGIGGVHVGGEGGLREERGNTALDGHKEWGRLPVNRRSRVKCRWT